MEDETDQVEQQESRDFKRLREQKEAAEQRANELAKTLLEKTIKEAGFDPTLGVVQRLAKDYDGEFDAAAFAKFAVAEGLTPTPSESSPVVTDAETQVQQQIAAAQAPGDALRAASTAPAPPADVTTRIHEAQAAGDWDKARHLSHLDLLNRLGQ